MPVFPETVGDQLLRGHHVVVSPRERGNGAPREDLSSLPPD
jgi:hypothetical protein